VLISWEKIQLKKKKNRENSKNTNFFRKDQLYRVSQNLRIPSWGSCREKSQESRKNKIKNIGEGFTKIYGSEGSNFSSCFLQIKNING
jgi:hypothetical protein